MFKRTWHTEESRAKNNGHTWAEYTPYSNVLWLKYIFGWLREQYLKRIAPENQTDLFYNISGVRELTSRFDLRSKQGFDSATEVLLFAVEQGWITNEQIEENGLDSTILSEYSVLRD
jgi:serine/threonine-protein kinase haspin